jgi:hypothetical protein
VGWGSCDGLKAKEFYLGCESHAETQTEIFDTKENMIGCFTRVEWEQSEEFSFHAEESAQHSGEDICIEGQKKHSTNDCDSKLSPWFLDAFVVSDNCNANTKSSTSFFEFYTNSTTELDKHNFFQGFEGAEMEVFKMPHLCPNQPTSHSPAPVAFPSTVSQNQLSFRFSPTSVPTGRRRTSRPSPQLTPPELSSSIFRTSTPMKDYIREYFRSHSRIS